MRSRTRWVLGRCLLVCGLATGVAWAEEGELVEAPAGDEVEAPAAEPVKLSVEATNLSWSQSMSLQGGQPQNEHESFNIQLRALMPPDMMILSYQVTSAEPAVTSAGERLAIDGRSGQSTVSEHQRQQNPPTFTFNVSPAVPTKEADRVTRLAGQLQLHVAEGPRRLVVFNPIREHEGHWYRVREMPDLRLRVVRPADDQGIQIRVEGASTRLFDRVEFQTAQGVTIQQSGWGGSSGGAGFTRTYRLHLPEDGRVVFHFLSDLRTVTAEFEVLDIPLLRGMGGGAPGEERWIDAVAEGELEPEGEAAGAEQVERLTVERVG
jgi:hypothetical protein